MEPRMVLAANASAMTLDGTRTYIVGRKRAVVIDPGPDDPAHLDAVVGQLEEAERVDIVVTHHHRDHAGGAVALASRLAGRLGSASQADSSASWPHRLRDGPSIVTDDGRLTAMSTPGHTPDHIALIWEAVAGAAEEGDPDYPNGVGERGQSGRSRDADGTGSRDMATRPDVFVGDLLLGEGDTALVAWPEGNVADYLRSLDRLAAIGAGRLFPAHGPAIVNPGDAIRRFRDHRRKRVEQVRLLLMEGPESTSAALVDRLYGPGLPAEIAAAAEGSVEAVRRYLASQGR